jgi:asparagine N-glycosylation enzyme membrane subunit Stt3
LQGADKKQSVGQPNFVKIDTTLAMEKGGPKIWATYVIKMCENSPNQGNPITMRERYAKEIKFHNTMQNHHGFHTVYFQTFSTIPF